LTSKEGESLKAKKVTNDAELIILHIDATTMVIQSRSDPTKGVLVEHDGHQATRCHNVKCRQFNHNNCYHREECNKVLEAQEREQEEALRIAQDLFTARTEAPLNGDRSFSILR